MPPGAAAGVPRRARPRAAARRPPAPSCPASARRAAPGRSRPSARRWSAAGPSSATTTSWPQRPSNRNATFTFTALSSASRMRSGRSGTSGAFSGTAGAARRPPPRSTACASASSSTGFRRYYGDSRARGRVRRHPARFRRRPLRSRARRGRLARDLRGHRQHVEVHAVGVEHDQPERRSRRVRLLERREGGTPAGPRPRPRSRAARAPPASARSRPRSPRDQHALPRAASVGDARQRSLSGTRSSRAVNRKTAAAAGRALDPNAGPACARRGAARWRAPARCRRSAGVVEPSACVKASKIGACLSAAMPMPVSRDRELAADARRRPAGTRRATRTDDDLAALGELDGVADQVDAAPGAAARRRRRATSGTAGSTRAGQLEPLARGPRRASGVGGVVEPARAPRTARGSSSSCPASILEKSRTSLMIAQQRVGRDCARSPGTRAARASASVVEQQVRHAQDAVHRRADLVAHVGEEGALERTRLLRPRALRLQRVAVRPAAPG